jgi:hypothetical protein
MIQRRRSKNHSGGSIGSNNLSSVASSLGSRHSRNGSSAIKENSNAPTTVNLPSCSPYRSCLKKHVHTTSSPRINACSRTKKTVRFKKIHIREYERICGDNQSCSAGPPIGYDLLWKGGHFVRTNWNVECSHLAVASCIAASAGITLWWMY